MGKIDRRSDEREVMLRNCYITDFVLSRITACLVPREILGTDVKATEMTTISRAIIQVLLTNSMELSTTREATSC
jgi:hypothetical protein